MYAEALALKQLEGERLSGERILYYSYTRITGSVMQNRLTGKEGPEHQHPSDDFSLFFFFFFIFACRLSLWFHLSSLSCYSFRIHLHCLHLSVLAAKRNWLLSYKRIGSCNVTMMIDSLLLYTRSWKSNFSFTHSKSIAFARRRRKSKYFSPGTSLSSSYRTRIKIPLQNSFTILGTCFFAGTVMRQQELNKVALVYIEKERALAVKREAPESSSERTSSTETRCNHHASRRSNSEMWWCFSERNSTETEKITEKREQDLPVNCDAPEIFEYMKKETLWLEPSLASNWNSCQKIPREREREKRYTMCTHVSSHPPHLFLGFHLKSNASEQQIFPVCPAKR